MFQIREYGRMELAQVYSPDILPESAWKRLRRWIKANPSLSSDLSSLGYDGSTRSFTPAMVQAIIKWIGEP